MQGPTVLRNTLHNFESFMYTLCHILKNVIKKSYYDLFFEGLFEALILKNIDCDNDLKCIDFSSNTS